MLETQNQPMEMWKIYSLSPPARINPPDEPAELEEMKHQQLVKGRFLGEAIPCIHLQSRMLPAFHKPTAFPLEQRHSSWLLLKASLMFLPGKARQKDDPQTIRPLRLNSILLGTRALT